MTVVGDLWVGGSMARVRSYVHQMAMVILINVPAVSFGLAMGWVSLASGETADGEDQGGDVVIAAATTFIAQLVGVSLSARAVAAGRKLALIVTSIAFVVCWSLKLIGGGWWTVCGRAAAGLGGAGAWTVAPLLAREMCEKHIRGAAVSAMILAHNLGFLLMYLAADARTPHRTVLLSCLVLSAGHCVVCLFMPESPAFLAAKGKPEAARRSLAWLRGKHYEDSTLAQELSELPLPEETIQSPWKVTKKMLSDCCRRRAFIITAVAIIGQESCGVFALLQFAERVFVLARDQTNSSPASNLTESFEKLAIGDSEVPNDFGHTALAQLGGDVNSFGVYSEDGLSVEAGVLVTPARHALMLGVVQFVASAVALYLVEKIGRRPLLVMMSLVTAMSLGAAACAVRWGSADIWAVVALATAVGADSGGMQPVPYALLADMFHYQYRGCALMLVTAIACFGNAVEVLVFPTVAMSGGIDAALGLSAALTAAYAVFTVWAVPETRGKTIDEIYTAFGIKSETDIEKKDGEKETTEQYNKETMCTKV